MVVADYAMCFCLQGFFALKISLAFYIALICSANGSNTVFENVKNVSKSYQAQCSKEPNLSLIVQRRSFLNGFHRELGITVTVEQKNNSHQFRQCHVLLKEAFPQDMFVDPYQIQQQPGLQNQVLLHPNDIDLEKLAQESVSQNIFIFFNASNFISNTSNNVTLPFHLRYQKPTNDRHNGNYVDVYLSGPTVLVHCRNADVVSECSHDVVKEMCSPQDRQECPWIRFQEIDTSPHLHFRVPHGDLKHLSIVTVITSLVISIGFLYLVYAIHGQQQNTSKYKSS